MATLGDLAYSINVGLLEFSSLPFACAEHLCSQLSLKLDTSWLVALTFRHFVRLLRNDSH